MEASCTVQTYTILINSSLKATKKIGWSNLKQSGERSRAILALLSYYPVTTSRLDTFAISVDFISVNKSENKFISDIPADRDGDLR